MECVAAVIVTHNEIEIRADPESIFDLAANVGDWPRILQHYRYVRVLDRPGSAPDERYVAMGARRSGIPVSWTSLQRVNRAARQIFYHHLGGATRGMDVLWRIEPRGDLCHVTIDHDLPRPRWWLRPRPAGYIAGHLFVEHIADLTLAGIKATAERAAHSGSAR